ncbi:Cyclin-dependent protein kinase complex component, putative [Penicillium digitatum PHI26]|uniref:Cyclin-dependent protein kinase complex component, putative n=2 Tax=Penicillium digitatum TaxID=36651 RepID=K9GBN3_PEND2|nr:Cyclin-dependent protein kinase complex component, putative [Penicillium digitatum Pd1]EKV10711.1 Cyclin-dependent protein kinase complex component, putative [Penicillium digitatum PHI26]EKV20619.1 Cyclin-dependent protein kinase complex component, putative [Penicillium digitatum Pd1]
MATAVTQIATIPVSQDTSSNQNANPAPTMLKVGSPFDNNARHQPADDSNSSQTPAAVFDISPEAALHLLCLNIERLSAFFAQKPVGTEELHAHGSTPLAYGTPAENELRVNTVGLHIKELDDPIDPTRMTEEAIQMAILAKKFLSKKVPPIPLNEYLLRLHRYCPMSTAVYLAASVYIYKMTLVENVLRVLPKNMHRLVLAGVWVASKALEDLSYPHSRVAKVGGVSEQELSKLEISFCFLADFELRVDAQMLMNEALRPQTSLE